MVDIKDIMQKNDFLTNQNANIRSYWEDIADYCLPRKGWINSIRTKGEQLKFNFIYDSTAIIQLRKSAAGFYSNLTNPSTKWFKLEAEDKELMRQKEVATWFTLVEDKMYSIFGRTNFYKTILEFFTNYLCFGTGVVLTKESAKYKLSYQAVPIEGVNIEDDENGETVGIYNNYRMTIKQAFNEWGGNCGKMILDKMDSRPYDEVNILHYVSPRYRRDPSKEDSANMPFESCWIDKDAKHLIAEGGFNELPYAVGRFYKDAYDTMGFAPTMDCLPWIKLINAQQRTFIRASMKASDPPIQVPSKGFVLPLNFNPGAINYRDTKTNADALQPMIFNGNFPLTIEHIKMIEEKIKEGFFSSLFDTLTDVNKQMTVPEVQRRISEQMVLLAPVIGGCTQDVLSPIVLRSFFTLYRNFEFPEPPPALSGQHFGVVYVSPLALASKQTEISSIDSFLGEVQAIGQVKPQVLDKINEDEVVDILAQMRSVNPRIIRSDKEVKGIRDAREQQMQQMQQMQMLQMGAQAGRDLGAAHKSGEEGTAVAAGNKK